MKGFKVKDDKRIQIMLESGEKNVITAMDDRDLHQVGYLNFKLGKDKTAYLWSIKVTDVEFLRTGVGTVMLNCFESYCARNYVRRVEGRFYPNGDGGIFAREFYEDHGYKFFRDGYEQYISKPLSYDNIDEKFLVSEEDDEQMADVFEDVFKLPHTIEEDMGQVQ